MLHHTDLQFLEGLTVSGERNRFIYVTHTKVMEPHSIWEVHEWHKKRKDRDGKPWAGFAYHYFISKDGEIYEGRPLRYAGAYDKAYNNNSISVCFEGDFDQEAMADEQLDASVMLISLLELVFEDDDVELLVKAGKRFPRERLFDKLSDCEKYLTSLFGSPFYTMIMDSEARNHYAGMGDEDAERRRQSCVGLVTTGNFDYYRILDLISFIKEDSEDEDEESGEDFE